MLKNEGKTGVKIIDFGSAVYANKKSNKYVQSRFYRAPEVIRKQPYSTQIDIWSLGCILFELHFGKPLFRGKNEVEVLQSIMLTQSNCINEDDSLSSQRVSQQSIS